MIETLSWIGLGLGLLLDLFTVVWAFQHARGGQYKSGFFAVPLLLYFVFVLNTDVEPIDSNRWIFILCAIVLHALAYTILPLLFDQFLKKRY